MVLNKIKTLIIVSVLVGMFSSGCKDNESAGSSEVKNPECSYNCNEKENEEPVPPQDKDHLTFQEVSEIYLQVKNELEDVRDIGDAYFLMGILVTELQEESYLPYQFVNSNSGKKINLSYEFIKYFIDLIKDNEQEEFRVKDLSSNEINELFIKINQGINFLIK